MATTKKANPNNNNLSSVLLQKCKEVQNVEGVPFGEDIRFTDLCTSLLQNRLDKVELSSKIFLYKLDFFFTNFVQDSKLGNNGLGLLCEFLKCGSVRELNLSCKCYFCDFCNLWTKTTRLDLKDSEDWLNI